MSQPIAGDQYTAVSAAGTTVTSNQGATLKRIILPGTFVGSVEWYDSSTAAGTAASNLVYNVGIPLLNQYKHIEVNAQFKKGITTVATGTPTLTFTWDK